MNTITIIESERMKEYMMAKEAFFKDRNGELKSHWDGDLFDLCYIGGEQGEYYTGHFITGFGIVGLRFPKETTRELTKEEVLKYHNKRLMISGNYIGRIDLTKDYGGFLSGEQEVKR